MAEATMTQNTIIGITELLSLCCLARSTSSWNLMFASIARGCTFQVQQGFGQVMDRAVAGENVVVERYGMPRVVIIEFHRYQRLLEAERELLRWRLQQASATASARAAHLSEAEVDALIERARSEVYEEHQPT
jgi:hypothetical protein